MMGQEIRGTKRKALEYELRKWGSRMEKSKEEKRRLNEGKRKEGKRRRNRSNWKEGHGDFKRLGTLRKERMTGRNMKE